MTIQKQVPAVTVGNVREWRGENVVDVAGDRIGTLESVYVDTATDEPAFAAVTVGVLGFQKLQFTPLEGATVGPTYLKVTQRKDFVKDGPSIGTNGELTNDNEARVFAHFNLPYEEGTNRRLGRR